MSHPPHPQPLCTGSTNSSSSGHQILPGNDPPTIANLYIPSTLELRRFDAKAYCPSSARSIIERPLSAIPLSFNNELYINSSSLVNEPNHIATRLQLDSSSSQ